MKTIFLIGDSIRCGAPESDGYGIHVKEKCRDKATVLAPDDNCRFTQYTLRYLHDWAKGIDGEKVDVVHWNNGLWEALRLFGDEPLTDMETYGVFLKRIYKRITFLFPNAKIIFALTTAVIEEWQNPDFFRYNREIEAYNRKATEIMNDLGVPVNDLYSVSKSFEKEQYLGPVHFGTEASAILADAVIRACDEQIGFIPKAKGQG